MIFNLLLKRFYFFRSPNSYGPTIPRLLVITYIKLFSLCIPNILLFRYIFVVLKKQKPKIVVNYDSTKNNQTSQKKNYCY